MDKNTREFSIYLRGNAHCILFVFCIYRAIGKVKEREFHTNFKLKYGRD